MPEQEEKLREILTFYPDHDKLILKCKEEIRKAEGVVDDDKEEKGRPKDANGIGLG